jgi:hypothetical protein
MKEHTEVFFFTSGVNNLLKSQYNATATPSSTEVHTESHTYIHVAKSYKYVLQTLVLIV